MNRDESVLFHVIHFLILLAKIGYRNNCSKTLQTSTLRSFKVALCRQLQLRDGFDQAELERMWASEGNVALLNRLRPGAGAALAAAHVARGRGKGRGKHGRGRG